MVDRPSQASKPRRAIRRSIDDTGSLAKQKLDVSGQGLWRDLLEGALFRRFVGAEADQLGAVAEAVAGDMIVAHLDHELRLHRLPFAAALGAPAARSARRFAGEARRRDQSFEHFGQRRALCVL